MTTTAATSSPFLAARADLVRRLRTRSSGREAAKELARLHDEWAKRAFNAARPPEGVALLALS